MASIPLNFDRIEIDHGPFLPGEEPKSFDFKSGAGDDGETEGRGNNVFGFEDLPSNLGADDNDVPIEDLVIVIEDIHRDHDVIDPGFDDMMF